MATYNGAAYLREQLLSIVAQTYPNLEIILVDDCSSDSTATIAEEFAEQYAHIYFYPSGQNVGYLKNFERGIRLATGDFIALSDQDDIWLPEKITRLMQRRGNVPLVYSDSELIDADGVSMNIRLSQLKNLLNFDHPLQYTVGGTASGHAMVVRKDVVLDSLPWPPMVTHDFWIGFVSTFTGGMQYVDEVLVHYRQHGGNVVGVTAGSSKATRRKRMSRAERNEAIRERMRLMSEKCPEALTEAKKAFLAINKSYAGFSLPNNFARMTLFLKHRDKITAYKKRNAFRRILFCLKMFVKIE